MANIQKYKMSLNVISALHTSGVDYKSLLKNSEYIYDRDTKRLSIIDQNKFVHFLIQQNLFDKYLEFIHENVHNVKHQQNKVSRLYDFLKKYNILGKSSQFTLRVYNNTYVRNDIRLFVRNAYGEPYLPGSSIKGAIVNSLLVDYIIRHPQEFEKIKQTLLSKSKRVRCKKDADAFREEAEKLIEQCTDSIIYYQVDSNRQTIKKFGIYVSDTYESKNITLKFLQDIDEPYNNKKSPRIMPIFREYVMPHSEFIFDLHLDLDVIKATKLDIRSADDILNSIKNASKYLTKDVLGIEKSEENLILGANTGFHQKTIIHALFKDSHERLQVTKALLHKKDFDDKLSHLNDKISPRVKNCIVRGHFNPKNLKPDYFKLAGIAQLIISEEKHVGKN